MPKIEDVDIDIPLTFPNGAKGFREFRAKTIAEQETLGRVLSEDQPDIARLRFRAKTVVLGPQRLKATVPERTPPKKRRR